MKTGLKAKVMIGLLGALDFGLPRIAEGFCLRNCVTAEKRGNIQSNGFATNYQQNQADRRQASHNFGDTSTNVMGDMNIQVGHERIDIKGMEHSTNSVIDASINSTIILGNVKQ